MTRTARRTGSDKDADFLIATAREEYASRYDFDAQSRADHGEYNGIAEDLLVPDLRQWASVARDLLADIELQLDEIRAGSADEYTSRTTWLHRAAAGIDGERRPHGPHGRAQH
ncbi:hypothetical protein ABH923_000314 [Leifsonia sp. EB41]|uniref:hypothetical protein n=1 Tax=Leifsonia sp. EB41 TaxID=3156260 RepID=UPI0035114A89